VPKGTGSVTLLPSAFDGDIDEVAVYSVPISNASIWAHFQNSVVQHAPYTFTAHSVAPPPPAYAGGQYLPFCCGGLWNRNVH
jgi:hypothetical protein